MSSDVPQDPTAGELDCLAVIWQAQEKGEPALKLSDVAERLGERRRQFGEPAPALTTVSTYLRSATAKRLLAEVRLADDGNILTLSHIRSRGAFGATRSPRTAYRAAFEPGDVFLRTFEAIIQAYPPNRRHEAIRDFARALRLPKKTIEAIQKLAQEKLSS